MPDTRTVFISYAREDFEAANTLYHDLKRAGASPWMDKHDLLPGENWRNRIETVVRASDFFLLLQSAKSVAKRGFVQSEIRQALDVLKEIPASQIYLIPARLDECTPSMPGIGDFHWVDLFPSYDEGLKKILRVVNPSATLAAHSISATPVQEPGAIASTGWGVIFAPGVGPDVKEALKPLLDRRSSEATAGSEALYKEFSGTLGYQPGDSAYDFLSRHGVGPGPAAPDRVPQNLLIVGEPSEIPFEFQQQLAVQYRVGRLAFDSADDYASYTRSVLDVELGNIERSRRVLFVAPSNPGSHATQLGLRALVRPLVETLRAQEPSWRIDAVIEAEATRHGVLQELEQGERPALLFVCSHGMVTSSGKPEQREIQGALVCSDWEGLRQVPESAYLSASTIPASTDLRGLVAFCFASFSAGTPQVASGYAGDRPTAPIAFVSRLPQGMLAHRAGGALAFIGLTGHGWAYSFSWEKAGPQTQVFEYALSDLLHGQSVGSAFAHFTRRYAELASALSDADIAASQTKESEQSRKALRIAMLDAKSYLVIGDPAVKMA